MITIPAATTIDLSASYRTQIAGRGAMFFVAVTPMALVMRLAGKKLLNMDYEPAAKSYWIERKPPGPPPESVRRQF